MLVTKNGDGNRAWSKGESSARESCSMLRGLGSISLNRAIGYLSLPRNIACTAMNDVSARMTKGRLGVITLQREKALNALTVGMSQDIQRALSMWEPSKECSAIMIHSSTPRALCAGGDIKAIRQAAIDQPYIQGVPATKDHHIASVFQSEYALVVHLSELRMPTLGICEGVWMGFGMGLAGFLDTRVVTEKTLWAMPECAIGLLPDVGFASMASRCMPVELALFLAMTGTRLRTPADLVGSGVGTHYVQSSHIPALKDALQSTDLAQSLEGAQAQVDGLLNDHTSVPDGEAAQVMPCMAMITKHFATAAQCMEATGSPVQSVQTLYSSLREEAASASVTATQRQWCEETLSKLNNAAPRSLAVTVDHFVNVFQDAASEGPLGKLRGCIAREFHVCTRMAGQHDFREGVRAAVVDKDKQPRWQPSRIQDVSEEDVGILATPIPGLRLEL
eukprot:jgi/Ulvmu1/8208/UM041_0017.1